MQESQSQSDVGRKKSLSCGRSRTDRFQEEKESNVARE